MASQILNTIQSTGTYSNKGEISNYERTQLALVLMQNLYLADLINKGEFVNMTKMAASPDIENLTVVEEIIKQKLS